MYLIAAKGDENQTKILFCLVVAYLAIQRFAMLFLPIISPRNLFSLVDSSLILRFPKKF